MKELYQRFEKINNYPKRINILKIIVAVCMAIIAISLIVLYKSINLFIIVLLCASAIIVTILFILICVLEKNIKNSVNKLKNEYSELKIINSNNVSNISITILGSTFLKGPESNGNILIIAILVDDTVEYQYMSKYAVEETFK